MQLEPTNLRPQFSLFGLMAIIALFSVVFGLLAAMGTPLVQVAIAFLIFGGVAGMIAAIIEGFAQLLGFRR